MFLKHWPSSDKGQCDLWEQQMRWAPGLHPHTIFRVIPDHDTETVIQMEPNSLLKLRKWSWEPGGPKWLEFTGQTPGEGRVAKNKYPRDLQSPAPPPHLWIFHRVLSSTCVWNYSKPGKNHSKRLKEIVLRAHTGTGIMCILLPEWKPVTHRTLEIILGKILPP